MRLIDADALRKRIKAKNTSNVMMKAMRDECVAEIDDAPTIKPEIILCKDCIHNGSFDTDCPINWCGKEYCIFAERRTDAD